MATNLYKNESAKHVTSVIIQGRKGTKIENLRYNEFKVCKSVHHHTVQINQPTRGNIFSSLLLDVYLRLNMFRASSRPSSGAQQLQ